MDKTLKGLRTVLYWSSIAAMATMLALIFFQVVSRYLFSFVFEWSEELARFLFVWVVFLGSALIMGEGGHLAVRLVPNRLAGTWAGVGLEALINLLSYIFILILVTQGGKMASMMSFQTAPGLGMSMTYVYVAMPVSGLLMLLYLGKETRRILGEVRVLASGRHLKTRPEDQAVTREGEE